MTFRANHLAVSERNSFPESVKSFLARKCFGCERNDFAAWNERTLAAAAAPADGGAAADKFRRTFEWLTDEDSRAVWLFAVIILDLMGIGKLEWLIREEKQRHQNKQDKF